MSEQSKRKQPTPQHTDFESMTHAQLVAMLNSANSESAYDLAAKLSKAASTITKIGDDLMTYVKGLEWQGEAGDTFREWGGQTASATLHLGEYADVASRWMGIVSQAIAEAKAVMPDTSETTAAQADLRTAEKSLAATKEPGARNDPDSRKLAQTAQSDATAAQGRIDAARYEAAQQMRKLAQTYQQSAAQVNSVEPPTFSPPAKSMNPDEWYGGRSHYESIAAPTGGSGNGTGSSASFGFNGRERESTSLSHPTVPGMQGVPRSEPVTMGLDGLNTLPRSPGPDLIQPSGVHGGSERPDTRVPSQPVGIPPFQGNRNSTGPTAPGHVPSATRAPFLPGQSMANGSTRMPRETGIVGGRPVPPVSGRPTGSLPRGTVIGEGTQGRTVPGRGLTPGMVAGNNSGVGHSNGAPTGRRLASENGGMIGNRPNQPGNGGSRPFTPGGTGLTRHSGHATPQGSTQRRDGATARAADTPSPRREPRQSDRPGYLTEDEETWQRVNRRPLPPVVD
ncbi:WXG100 family type VII secretion target [Streptomyces caniscabiei]|uniref:WXG100 family type VII secretion target n=1 Tax=Streptomyces caniscabiei TaxID=2746961 RepID=UPI0038F73B53